MKNDPQAIFLAGQGNSIIVLLYHHGIVYHRYCNQSLSQSAVLAFMGGLLTQLISAQCTPI